MARPRTPSNVLELRGAFAKNPQRKRPNEPKPVGDVGSYSIASCDPAEIWEELKTACPKNVLTQSDRLAFEIAVEFTRQFRENPTGLSSERIKTLINLLARFGMTPADRAKIDLGSADTQEESPWARLAAKQ